MSEPYNTYQMMQRGMYPAAGKAYRMAVARERARQNISRLANSASALVRQRSLPLGKAKGVRAIVRKEISRLSENKFTITPYSLNLNTAVASNPVTVPIFPSLSNGASRYQRLGNRVRVKKCTVKGTITGLPYNATTNPAVGPVFVKMWVISSIQQQQQFTTVPTSIQTDFFDYGNGGTAGGTTGPAGTLLDLSLDVDPESWRVHRSAIVRLGITASTSSTSGALVNDNSEWSHNFSFDLSNIYKVLKFADQTTAGLPTNHNLYLIFQPVYGVSTVTPLVTHVPAAMQCVVRVEYEDF